MTKFKSWEFFEPQGRAQMVFEGTAQWKRHPTVLSVLLPTQIALFA